MKKRLDGINVLYPTPTTIVGAMVGGKPNFLTIAHDLFIGEIVETYADESVLSEEKVDIKKVKPLLFDMGSIKYWSLGDAVANCWSIGKKLKKK